MANYLLDAHKVDNTLFPPIETLDCPHLGHLSIYDYAAMAVNPDIPRWYGVDTEVLTTFSKFVRNAITITGLRYFDNEGFLNIKKVGENINLTNTIIYIKNTMICIKNSTFDTCIFGFYPLTFMDMIFESCSFKNCIIPLCGKAQHHNVFVNCTFEDCVFLDGSDTWSGWSSYHVPFDSCTFVGDLVKKDTAKINPYWCDGLTKTGEHTVWKVVRGSRLTGEDHVVLLKCTIPADVPRIPSHDIRFAKLRAKRVRVDAAYIVGDISMSYSMECIDACTDGCEECELGEVYEPTWATDSDAEGNVFVSMHEADYSLWVRVFGADEQYGLSSFFDSGYFYTVGEISECAEWDSNILDHCSGGIHVFLHPWQALEYAYLVIHI